MDFAKSGSKSFKAACERLRKRHLAGSMKDFSNERRSLRKRSGLRELRGPLDIQSNSTDTQITVTVPPGEQTRQTPG
jgi:hypothetical protein